MKQAIGLFLELLRTAVAGIGDLLAGADLWPVIVFSWAFGLLLVQLTVLIVVSFQFRRLGQVGHDLRELSKIVERQAQAIEQLARAQKGGLTPAPRVFPPVNSEDNMPDKVQSADGLIALHEQLKALREVMLAETTKND